MSYSSFFECREPGVLPEHDEEIEAFDAEREAEWERQQRAAEIYGEVPSDEAPWTWGPEDEDRVERALAQLRRELRAYPLDPLDRDDNEPF